MAQNPQTKTATTAKPTTVLERIKAFFKLDDAGRVENFFKNEIKAMRLRIRAIEMNIKSDELKLEIELAAIDSSIEDAIQGIEDAYTAVKPEDVTNNESMTKFSPKYWKAIEAADWEACGQEPRVQVKREAERGSPDNAASNLWGR